MLSHSSKKHSAWFAPLLMNNLKDRIAAIEEKIGSAGKSKPKYVEPLNIIKGAIEQLDLLNQVVIEKGPYKLDVEGQPLIKNREIQFIDELDDPNLNSIFNTIKTQVNLIVAASHNTFKPKTENHTLITSLNALCEDFFNKYHRASKQEIEKRFYVDFYVTAVKKDGAPAASSGLQSLSLDVASRTQSMDGSVDSSQSQSSSPFNSYQSKTMEKDSPPSSKRDLDDESELEPGFSGYLALPAVQEKLTMNRQRIQKALENKRALEGEVSRIFNDLPGAYPLCESLARDYVAIKTMKQEESEVGVEFEESTWLNLVAGSAYYDLFDDNGTLLPEVKKQLGEDLIDALYASPAGALKINNTLIASYLMLMGSLLTTEPRLMALDKNAEKSASPLVLLGKHFNTLASRIQTDKGSIASYKEILAQHVAQPLQENLKKSIQNLDQRFKHRNQLKRTIKTIQIVDEELVSLKKVNQSLEAASMSLQEQLKMQAEKLEQQKKLLVDFNEDREKLERQLKAAGEEISGLEALREALNLEKSRNLKLEELTEQLIQSATKIKAEKMEYELKFQEEQSKAIMLEEKMSKLKLELEASRSQAQAAAASFENEGKNLLRKVSELESQFLTQEKILEELRLEKLLIQATINDQAAELDQLRPLKQALIEAQERYRELDVKLKSGEKAFEELERKATLLASEKAGLGEQVGKLSEDLRALGEETQELRTRTLNQEKLLQEQQQQRQQLLLANEQLEVRVRELQGQIEQRNSSIVHSAPIHDSDARGSVEAVVDESAELRRNNAALLIANQQLQTRLEQSLQRTAAQIAPPAKTPWWKYALAALTFTVGAFALATGVGAAIGVPLLALGMGVAAGISMATSGAAVLVASGVYTGLQVRADQRAQEAYSVAVKQSASEFVYQQNRATVAQQSGFQMGRSLPLQQPSVLANSLYRPRAEEDAPALQQLPSLGLTRSQSGNF